MNGAEYIVQSLMNRGIETLFGYPGGCIMPLYDAFFEQPIKHILCRHEQGAAFAANGYARATGRVGVCVATSGPGATNLITGLADAKLDSVPMIALTGQVPTGLIGTDAFQEVDILGMSLSVTKQSYLVDRIETLPQIFEEAFYMAQEGRPGPVLIDLPKDILLGALPEKYARFTPPETTQHPETIASYALAKKMIEESKQPIIYAGGGIAHAQVVEPFREFVEQCQIPTIFSLKGLGALPSQHPLNLGMLGMHGSASANKAVQESDLLIAIGTRFDDRVTGRLAEFAPMAKVIHLDIDAAEISKLRTAHCPLKGELVDSMSQIKAKPDIKPWIEKCQARHQSEGFTAPVASENIDGPSLLAHLKTCIKEEEIICCDVGQHQMWVAQHYPIDHPQRHLTSGGLGTMGFGLPAAIGAQLANPDKLVINLSGDGSIMMNIQELATLNRYNIPLKIIVLDNSALGMVRQQQTVCYDQRYSEIDLSDNPDFTAVARAFGLTAFSVEKRDDLDNKLNQLLATPGPALLHAKIDARDGVWPMVKPGDSNKEMLMGDAA